MCCSAPVMCATLGAAGGAPSGDGPLQGDPSLSGLRRASTPGRVLSRLMAELPYALRVCISCGSSNTAVRAVDVYERLIYSSVWTACTTAFNPTTWRSMAPRQTCRRADRRTTVLIEPGQPPGAGAAPVPSGPPGSSQGDDLAECPRATRAQRGTARQPLEVRAVAPWTPHG